MWMKAYAMHVANARHEQSVKAKHCSNSIRESRLLLMPAAAMAVIYAFRLVRLVRSVSITDWDQILNTK